MRKRGRKEGKMGRAPCCEKSEVKKGAWTPEEDKILLDYITKNGHGTWRSFPKLAGLRRCGKSCRLRWTNYLRPDIIRGTFSFEEEQTIIQLHNLLGNKWAAIASRLPGRTDNEIKNFWNSHLRKRIPNKGLNLQTHSPHLPSTSLVTKSKLPSTHHMAEWESGRVEGEARLPVDPMLLAPETGVSNCDYFLRVWNSGAGEAFQRTKDFYKMASASPCPQASPVIKVESDSIVTGPTFTVASTGASTDKSFKECMRCKVEAEEMPNVSDSPNSYTAEKSSDITLDLLLDFPNDGEYLEFLQGESNDNSASPQH